MIQTVLVAGASGIVGRAALEEFGTTPGWRAIGVSRRPPHTSVGEHVPLDLLDAGACARFAAAHSEITHVIYAALFEKPGLIAGWHEPDQMQTNLTMLENLLGPLQERAASLRHVNLLQGTKAYGAHVHPMRVPGKEREPRDDHENFYWLQEDWLVSQQRRAQWRYTIWRPPVILGHAIGAPMNLIAALGAYLALVSAAGEGAGWPGGPGQPTDVVDADLLARAMRWAADAPLAANETFNVTNGDVLVWEHAWSACAAAFGLAAEPPQRRSIAAYFAQHAASWARLARRHRLAFADLEGLVGDSGIYADVLWNTGGQVAPPSSLLSTVKLRRAGFGECMDSEDCVLKWLNELRKMRIVPQ